MSLSFLNPWFLAALAAGIVPVLIHRLTRRRAVRRPFSAVRLLLRSQEMMARPHRLKHLILLALRILAVVALVLLMARPAITRRGLFGGGEGAGRVLVLDNSLSMGFLEERGLRFSLARRAVREILEGSRGRVLVLPTVPDGRKERPWAGPEEALKEIEAIPLSFGKGEPGEALGEAFRRLGERKGPGEVLLVTDLAAGDWDGVSPDRVGPAPPEIGVRVVRIGGARRDPNRTVKSVAFGEGAGVAGVAFRLEATVANLSDEAAPVQVGLFLGGAKVDQKSVDVKAGGEEKASFELRLEKPGWVNGEIRLPGDRLAADDRFYFALKVREKVKALVVDGDPKASLRASESYYLRNALAPGGSERSPFSPRVVTERELEETDPKAFDVFVLLNVARPPAGRIASFLDAGKPVFLYLGDRVLPEEYHRLALFPWRIGAGREGGPFRIGTVEAGVPALRPFSAGPAGESLRTAAFRRYFRVEGKGKVLLAFSNGDPLLVEAERGRGRLFLFASSADLDWNDLPLKAAFLPLVQGLLKGAVGLEEQSLPADARLGQAFPEPVRPDQIEGPAGGPGIYRFGLPAGELRRGVNPPFGESALSKLGDSELKKKLGTANLEIVEYREGAVTAGLTTRAELWPWFLGLLLAVLAAESLLAARLLREAS